MPSLRTLAPVVPAALLAAGLAAGWAASLALGPLRPADFAREAGRAERLDAIRASIRERQLFRERACRELMAGRLSLREAVAAVLADEAGRPPEARPAYQRRNDGGSVEESAALCLLTCLECDLRGDPRREEVLTRLRGELAELQAGSDLTRRPEGSEERAVEL